jgi:ketosteroid isomerase-like protein
MESTDNEQTEVATEEGVVAAFLTALVDGDTEAMADLVTEDAVLHQPRWPLDVEGREAIVEKTRSAEGTFADVAIKVDQSVRSGDRIAAQATASGRNVGALRMEDREIAPTGRAFTVPQFGIYRLEDGKVAEAWVLADALGIVEQLDNLPKGLGKMIDIGLRQLRWRLGGRQRLE